MDLGTMLSRPITHRGLHSIDGPIENSLPAVEAALGRGFGIEIDVRLSKDGVAVVHHDTSLRRVCGINRKVRDVEAKDLDPILVPRLDRVLEIVGGRTPLFLDLKCSPRPAERQQLAGEIRRSTLQYDGPVAVVGFDAMALRAVARQAPWVVRGQSGGVPLGRRTESWAKPATRPWDALWFARISEPHFVSYNVDRMPYSVLDRLRRHLPIVGWTLRCRSRATELADVLDQVIAEGAGLPA